MATKARQLAKQPPNKAFKDEVYNEPQNSPENKIHTRAKIIRNMNNTQHIRDKAQEPEVYKMKWKYAEVMRIGITNIRGMKDPVKRGYHPTNGKTQYRRNVLTRNKNTTPATK